MRIEPLDELGCSESDVYFSRHTLGVADRRRLGDAFPQQTKSGRVWQPFSGNYPPGSLGGSIRPLP